MTEQFNTRLENTSTQINIIQSTQKGIQSSLVEVFDVMNHNRSQIYSLNAKKLDLTEFEAKLNVYEEELETIRYATYDCYRVIK